MLNINNIVEILKSNSSMAIPISLFISIIISLLGVLPSVIVTLTASISNVNIIIFIIATFLGKIPSIALESLISYDIINIYDMDKAWYNNTIIAIYKNYPYKKQKQMIFYLYYNLYQLLHINCTV